MATSVSYSEMGKEKSLGCLAFCVWVMRGEYGTRTQGGTHTDMVDDFIIAFSVEFSLHGHGE